MSHRRLRFQPLRQSLDNKSNVQVAVGPTGIAAIDEADGQVVAYDQIAQNRVAVSDNDVFVRSTSAQPIEQSGRQTSRLRGANARGSTSSLAMSAPARRSRIAMLSSKGQSAAGTACNAASARARAGTTISGER